VAAKISQFLIDRYSVGPSESKVGLVASLQNTIRSVLSDDDYDTFLQGSYRNGTALAEINDVDIVARRKAARSPLSASEWEALFNAIATRLRFSNRIPGVVSLGNKCVKLKTASLNADIVPAVARGEFTEDPLAIWSRRLRSEILNYPRTHYENDVKKQARTSDSYKPTVRLMKRWARQYSDMSEIAPSFYIECAVYGTPDSKFSSYLPLGFLRVGREICSWSRYNVLYSIAGDKDILDSDEWHPDRFETFKARLEPDLKLIEIAIQAATTDDANRLWRLAFGD